MASSVGILGKGQVWVYHIQGWARVEVVPFFSGGFLGLVRLFIDRDARIHVSQEGF